MVGYLLMEHFILLNLQNIDIGAAAYIKKMRKSGGITDTTMVPEKEPGDYLIRHGWVLLHNPHNYEFKVTADPTKSYTKSQIDFLYDYFMKHGMENKANELFLI